MRLRIVLLALGARSVWMTDYPEQRRAGQSEASATLWCRAQDCGLRLYPSKNAHLTEYVCNNRHVWRWDEAKRDYVLQQPGT
jgi:hypothetical protein